MHNVLSILHAPFFVVSFFAECIDRTAGYAFPADVLSKMQTIGMLIIIRSGCWQNFSFSDDRANAHCLSNRGYKAVAEAKGSKAPSISGMTF